jgi:hypothetical protein
MRLRICHLLIPDEPGNGIGHIVRRPSLALRGSMADRKHSSPFLDPQFERGVINQNRPHGMEASPRLRTRHIDNFDVYEAVRTVRNAQIRPEDPAGVVRLTCGSASLSKSSKIFQIAPSLSKGVQIFLQDLFNLDTIGGCPPFFGGDLNLHTAPS